MVYVRTENEVNPNYPLLAWDGKGTRLAVFIGKREKQNYLYMML